jgi:hypothetical protein
LFDWSTKGREFGRFRLTIHQFCLTKGAGAAGR